MNPRREGDGWTPLHLASLFGKVEVAQALMEAGARPSVKGSDGLTAEDVAKKYRHHALADILHRSTLQTSNFFFWGGLDSIEEAFALHIQRPQVGLSTFPRNS